MKSFIEQLGELQQQNILLKQQNEELKKQLAEQAEQNNDAQLDIMLALADIYETNTNKDITEV